MHPSLARLVIPDHPEREERAVEGSKVKRLKMSGGCAWAYPPYMGHYVYRELCVRMCNLPDLTLRLLDPRAQGERKSWTRT